MEAIYSLWTTWNVLCKLNVHYRVHKSPSLHPTSIMSLTFCFCETENTLFCAAMPCSPWTVWRFGGRYGMFPWAVWRFGGRHGTFPSYTALQHRRQHYSQSLPWKPQTQHPSRSFYYNPSTFLAPMRAICTAHLIPLHLIILTIFGPFFCVILWLSQYQ
jgi:hypothetical protein